jgi:hypothetical protein
MDIEPFAPPEPEPDPEFSLDPDIQLQRDIHLEAVDTLRRSLPPPPINTPEAWLRRDRVALAKVAELVPANATESALAASHVAALAHFNDCTRQASLKRDDPRRTDQLRSQAASMGREARGFLGSLLRAQGTRKRREADPVACDRAAMTEHCVLGLMMDALDRLPPLPESLAVPPADALAGPIADGAPAAPPSPAAAVPAAPKQYLDYKDWPEEVKRKDRLRSAVDRYAIVHTMQAQLIRRLRRLPDNCDFEPPEPEVLEALINGDSLNLRWCDEYVPWEPPVEAK